MLRQSFFKPCTFSIMVSCCVAYAGPRGTQAEKGPFSVELVSCFLGKVIFGAQRQTGQIGSRPKSVQLQRLRAGFLPLCTPQTGHGPNSLDTGEDLHGHALADTADVLSFFDSPNLLGEPVLWRTRSPETCRYSTRTSHVVVGVTVGQGAGAARRTTIRKRRGSLA
jgi:hypothetical protein